MSVTIDQVIEVWRDAERQAREIDATLDRLLEGAITGVPLPPKTWGLMLLLAKNLETLRAVKAGLLDLAIEIDQENAQ